MRPGVSSLCRKRKSQYAGKGNWPALTHGMCGVHPLRAAGPNLGLSSVTNNPEKTGTGAQDRAQVQSKIHYQKKLKCQAFYRKTLGAISKKGLQSTAQRKER